MFEPEVPENRTLSQARRITLEPEATVHPERRLVIVKFGKRLTIRDVEQYAARLRANPAFSPSFSEIVDLTEIEELDLQANDFLRLADEIDLFTVDARRAFVAQDAQDHAARMHKILRTQKNIEIFKTVKDAERWIRTQSS